MQIQLRYFAAVREIMNAGKQTIELSEGATVQDALDQLTSSEPRLAPLNKAIMLMVNQEYVSGDSELHDGDELALIPPVSGGNEVDAGRFKITPDPLSIESVTSLVQRNDAGAVSIFVGTVRDNARGRSVTALDYEAYESAATKFLHQIGTEISERWPGAESAIWHRTGLLQVGEASVVIATSSAHRDEAFAASRYAIERIKQIVPIWKKEHYADGSSWIGSESDYQIETGRVNPPA